MRQRIAIWSLACLAAVALVGCSSGTSQSAAPAASAVSAAPSSAEPSSGAPSEAAASSEPSLALPSFELPSSDKALEALIPDNICGAKALKGSMTGDQVFSGNSDPTVVATLQSLGKTKADVSAAVGFAGACGVFIIRVKGVNEADLTRVFLAEAVKDGKTYSQAQVGGKTVLTDDPTSFDYAYIKGDGVIVVSANSKQSAEDILSALP